MAEDPHGTPLDRRAFLRDAMRYGIVGAAGVFLVNDVAHGQLVDPLSRVRPSDGLMAACDCAGLCATCHDCCTDGCPCVCPPEDRADFQGLYSPHYVQEVVTDRQESIAYTDNQIRQGGTASAGDQVHVLVTGAGQHRQVHLRKSRT